MHKPDFVHILFQQPIKALEGEESEGECCVVIGRVAGLCAFLKVRGEKRQQ